jgi:hypothetical protein
LHPTEWAIGEAVGTLSAEAVRQKRPPAEIHRDLTQIRQIQMQLLEAGHPLVWFDDVKPEDPVFAAVQWAALAGLVPLDPDSLHFRPADPVTGAEVAAALGSKAPAGIAERETVNWTDLGVTGKSGIVTRAELAKWFRSQ